MRCSIHESEVMAKVPSVVYWLPEYSKLGSSAGTPQPRSAQAGPDFIAVVTRSPQGEVPSQRRRRCLRGALRATVPSMPISWPPLASPGNAVPGPRVRAEEWLELPEDESGELVAGRMEDEEMPDAVHELAVAWLIWILRTWLGPAGFVFGSELKTLTGPDNGRKPDVSVFFAGRTAPPRRGPIREPADILVEIVSPSPRDERRDRVEKMAEYAAFGVRYYWLLDPALGSFEIFERIEDGYYAKVVGATSGRVDPVPGCAGLVLDLDALWLELARLSDE